MATVLGKRTRSATSTSPCGHSKRQATSIRVHKDDEDSVVAIDLSLSVTKSASKGLASLRLSTPSKTRVVSRPAKHNAKGAPVSVIVKGIDAHFGVSKSQIAPLTEHKTINTPPVTPRHRDSLKNNPITPQNKILVPGSVLTPRTPVTPSSVSRASPYAQARQLFTGCSDHGLLVGREGERAQVKDFITSCLESSTGGCLYVSGPPGTGKSAYIGDIIGHVDIQAKTACATINCMSIKSAADLTKTLASEFNLGASIKRRIDPDTLKKHFTAGMQHGQLSLLMLDEVDQLVDLDLELLYALFEWAMNPSSNLILIGIANALDLTDRLLPRLKSRNIKPALLPFMPYSATQINDIITTKLKSLNTDKSNTSSIPFVQAAAILLCSKKVASQTGDLRKAFDIIKRALTLAESEARASHASRQLSPTKTPLSENVNLSSPPVTTVVQTKLTALCHLTPETAPKATIAHVAKVTSQIFSNGMSSRLSQLNIQQKAVLCSLAVFEKNARSSLHSTLSSMTSFVPSTPSKSGRGGQKVDSPTTKQLYDSYAELCKREKLLHALSSVEFKDVLSGLETLSLIEFVESNGKTGTLGLMTPTKTPGRRSKKAADFGQMSLGSVSGDDRRVSSVVGFKELSDSITGAGSEILREILEG